MRITGDSCRLLIQVQRKGISFTALEPLTVLYLCAPLGILLKPFILRLTGTIHIFTNSPEKTEDKTNNFPVMLDLQIWWRLEASCVKLKELFTDRTQQSSALMEPTLKILVCEKY